MKYMYLLAFAIIAVIQWIIPGRMIWEKNRVLKKGNTYKFRTEPIDPSHPFKGKYITLNFAENSFTDTISRDLASNDEVYAILATDARGFATIKDLSTKRPQQTDRYLKATVYYVSRYDDSITVYLNYPFTEFYMQEFQAPKAETIYRESSSDSTKVTYALVRIFNGDAVIENVFINDTPIRELIK